MTQEALKLALEALEEAWYHVGTFQPTEKAIGLYDEARTAIKEALAQPEQAPVAQIVSDANGFLSTQWADEWTPNEGDKLYTTPPQRTEQEPVAFDCCGNCLRPKHEHQGDNCPKPYTTTWNAWDYPFAPDTTPPQRTWVDLTDEEVSEVFGGDIHAEHSGELRFVRAIEAELKEKNT
jgi:hypothetical protein